MKMYFFKVLIISLCLNFISSEDCGSHETCGQCIGSTLHCVWCPDEHHNGPRCASSEKIDTKWCAAASNPLKEVNITKINTPLKPSHVKIKARPGDTVSFEITYKPEKDYPIDIYYLFDNSYTMKDYKEDLSKEAKNIYELLNKTSNNVQFGAGSFVEKLGLPFANKILHKPNTFNNHLSLTNNIEEFSKAIDRVNYTGNLDDPEAGLDALMQAMVCWKQIGWRNDSRRIIIYSTDETYHSTGDGKAVGAFLPNDMKCHLTPSEDGISTHIYDQEASLKYDYPSVGQINYMAEQTDIHIFFTATKKVEEAYRVLEKAVRRSMYTELVVKSKETESVLAKTIAQQYRDLSQSLQISYPVVPDHLELELNPECNDINDPLCKIPYDQQINLTATVRVKSCPKNNEYNSLLTIAASGTDKLTIDIEVLCQCDCEKQRGGEKSPRCSSNGTYQCGVCKCDKGWYGRTCECSGISTDALDLRACKHHENDDKPCSGRGKCGCGKCTCNVGFEGKQCQYKMNDCPAPENNICSGHGDCKDNSCTCHDGWIQADCSCSTSHNLCIGANMKECSGHGNCTCNTCTCTDDRYSGKYCDQCDTCVEERCEQLKPYVICYYDGKKTNDKHTCDRNTKLSNNIDIYVKNRTEFENWSEGNECNKFMDDGSVIMYKYLDGNNFTEIWVESELKPPPKTDIWIPIGSAVGAILLVGILTMIAWKILVDIHDAREYRKFAQEADRSGYDVKENPLYKRAAVSVHNPAYTSM